MFFMLFTFLVFGIFLSLFDVFIIQHLHDNVKRLMAKALKA